MRSILFSLGNFPIFSFGACVALGLLFAHTVIARVARRDCVGNPDFASNIVVLLISAGFVGARAAYVMEHWTSHYRQSPADILDLRAGGLMFFGGFITSLIVALIYAKISKIKPLALIDVLAPALPLAHAFGRLGCFMNGCCYGRVTDAWYGVLFPPGSPPHIEQGPFPVIPTQLMESGLNLLIFVILILLAYRVKTRPGVRAGLYMMLYAVARYCVEGLRADERMQIGIFSISQFISLGVFTAGAILIIQATSRKPLQD